MRRTPDGRLCLLDWGLVASLPPRLRGAMVLHVAHLVGGDYDKVREGREGGEREGEGERERGRERGGLLGWALIALLFFSASLLLFFSSSLLFLFSALLFTH